MKTLAQICAVVAVIMFVGVAFGKEKAPKPLKGEVVKVDGKNLVVKVKSKTDPKEVTVLTDNSTVVMIEGVKGALADLKPGQMVNITPADGTATKIEVPKPKAKKGQ